MNEQNKPTELHDLSRYQRHKLQTFQLTPLAHLSQYPGDIGLNSSAQLRSRLRIDATSDAR